MSPLTSAQIDVLYIHICCFITISNFFPLVINYNPSSMAIKTQNFTYFMVTTLTFWGHVTSSVTWPLDSTYVVSYWWSIVTMRLTCTVTEI